MQTIPIPDNLSKSFTDEQLNSSLKDTDIRLIKWVIGLMIAQTTITITILKIFG